MVYARRADIDTLRAVSVISVIIFHLDQSFFPNGYLGVDIFFVISGYVITKSILKSLKRSQFTFLNFYIKRIKRIFPAFLIVLFTSFIFAIFILLKADLNRYLESLISSLGLVSNFYFWVTGGYFSTSDQLKPLLHIWSLSVEEQFYLFFPIFLYLVFKFKNQTNIYLLMTILVVTISFFINLFFISKGHRDVIFFMFPARIWQFGLGAIFAMAPTMKIKNSWFDFIYLLSAVFLIIFNFIKKINFLPDATFACLGASLILYNVNNKNILSNIFKFKPLIFLGLISYSLYLWHWPIISFLKYIYIDSLSIKIIILSTLLIFLLSCLTWKFVEQLFQFNYSNKKVIIFVIAGYVSLLLGSLAILETKNFPSRYAKFPNVLANSIGSTYNCSRFEYIKFGDTYACLLNPNENDMEKDILFGNSHAYMYGWPFKKYLIDTNQEGLIVQLSSCLPFIDKNISKECLKKSRAYYEDIVNDKTIKNVILGFTWYSKVVNEKGKIIEDEDFKVRRNSINFLIDSLKNNNKNVYLIGPIEIPGLTFSPEIISREIVFKKKENIEFFNPRLDFNKKYNTIIEYYKSRLGKNFLQPHEELCDEKNCYFADNHGSFFSDSNHLGKYGSLRMTKFFANIK
tara:strand:- start:553 stop:2436 length:1884 start_codon:yes stop_codon:yes gene_type:complete